MKCRSNWVALVAILVAPTTAVAGNGPWPALTGLGARANSAITAQTNPAGMSRFEKSEFIGQLAVVTVENEDTTAVTGLGLSSEDDDSSVYGGPLFYYVRPLSERWAVGLSMAVPGGFGDDYGSNSPTRYLVEEWSLAYVALVPAVSYKVNDQLSVGASAQINYAKYEVENSVLNVGEPDGEMTLEADGVTVSFNASLLYQFDDRTRVGLNYRSAVDMELEGDPEFRRLSTATRSVLDAAGLLNIDIDIDSKLPPVWLAGVYHELDNGWGIAVDVGRVEWSEFKLTEFGFLEGTLLEQSPEYDDTWTGSVGVSIPLQNKWTLGFGVAYAESPLESDTRTFLFRADKTFVLGAGVEYDLGDNRSMTFNLSYLDLGDGKIESPSVPFLGRLEAEYDEHWGLIFDLQYRWGT